MKRWLSRFVAGCCIAAGNRAEGHGDLRAACEWYRRAVRRSPGYARAHLNLGIGLDASGDADGARSCFEQALRLDAADPYAHYNLGKLLSRRGELDGAQRHLGTSLDINPDFAEARVLLADVLERRGDAAAAEQQLAAALRSRPRYFAALFNRALVLVKLHRRAEAETCLLQAVAVEPGNPDAHYGLFDLYRARGDLPAAARELRRTIECAPAFVPAYSELAAILVRQGRWQEALQAYGEARKHEPAAGEPPPRETLVLASAEVFLLNFSDTVAEDELFSRHRSVAARLESAFPPRFAAFDNDRDPGRRLRVGYVSGDFRYHPVTIFAQPLIERHDRAQCQVYCYARGGGDDEFTRRAAQAADVWRDVTALTAAQIADAIHGDGIDLLVDLSGHSGVMSLDVFALQPAPVQAAWLGYLNTTGMTRIRYRICDPYTDPPGLTERFHSETLVRLPRTQWCYRPFVALEHAVAPPSAGKGRVTFGSFAQIAKLSASTRRLWAEILRRLPGSTLMILGAPDDETKAALSRSFAEDGVDASRIEVAGYVGLQEYFRRFDAVDIALDPSPYSGGTTTCDALWMGVPVITMQGRRSASRSATSILTNAGLADCVATDAAGYVELALRLAQDRGRIAELRRTLRSRLQASPVMDEAGFARDMEAAYRRMWLDWCEGPQTLAAVSTTSSSLRF